MAPSNPIPVRLTDELLARIDAVLSVTGIQTRSAFIKFCVVTFLDYYEKHGNAALPPDWEAILKGQDQRTHRYKNKPTKKKSKR